MFPEINSAQRGLVLNNFIPIVHFNTWWLHIQYLYSHFPFYVGAFVICGIGTSVCSYISPFGYRGRYTQRRDIDSTKGRAERNALRLHDSLWYSFASWMQQVR